MSGPRDLRRGRYKPHEAPADPKEIIGNKSYYEILTYGRGWAIIIHRRGQFPETICCETEGEVRRACRSLSDDGLVGLNPGAL